VAVCDVGHRLTPAPKRHGRPERLAAFGAAVSTIFARLFGEGGGGQPIAGPSYNDRKRGRFDGREEKFVDKSDQGPCAFQPSTVAS